jgi:uncharacterized phage protein (TIGR01671 family)
MKEIKFRAWDKMNKKIFYLEHKEIFYDLNDRNNLNLVFYKTNDKIIDEGIGDFELMQYTGLKDKNGKEIYEGDIVEIEETGETYIVEFDIKKAKYIFRDNCGTGHNFDFNYYGNTFEVIGNIYENPELLEEE